MAHEEWRDVVGYEGIYQVSNLGRVKSVNRKDNLMHFHAGRLLVEHKRPNGYRYVHLSKMGIAKWYSIHRLVATAFCEKPDGCDVVNHLDNCPSNNCANNLEWTTYAGNMQHAARQGRMKHQPQNLTKAQESRKIPVIAISSDGTRTEFESQRAAGEALGLASGHIAACCRQEYGYKTIKGYRFEYADRELQAKQHPKKVGMSKDELRKLASTVHAGNTYNKGKKFSSERRRAFIESVGRRVLQLDKDTGEIIGRFDCLSDAMRAFNTKGISECVRGRSKTSAGYKWIYEEDYEDD